MLKTLLQFSVLTAAAALSHATPAPQPLPNPAGPGAMGPALALAPDGSVVMSWLEPRDGETWALCFSRLDASTAAWSAPLTIATGRDWFVNWADFPSVTPLSGTDLMAVWFENNPAPAGGGHDHHGTGYHARHSLSHDGGATWSTPQRITGESAVTEFAAVLALGENSRALVAWLDGRDRAANGGVQKLYAQTLLASGTDAPVDPSVCDCCQLSLVRTDGGALLAYRGRTADEIRDIRLARWRDGKWEAPRSLHDDGWQIAACPVNGPRLAAHDGRVAAVWFTAAQNQPRVLARVSTDGGETFGEVRRLDLGRPQGRVDALVLPDGATLFSWLEATGRADEPAGGIYLRRLEPDGTLGPARLLAASSVARAGGFPRLALLDGSRLLLAYTLAGEPSRVVTLLLGTK